MTDQARGTDDELRARMEHEVARLRETLEAAAQAVEGWDESKEPFTRRAVASVIRSLMPPPLPHAETK